MPYADIFLLNHYPFSVESESGIRTHDYCGICLVVISVTWFGEILPLLWNFKGLFNFKVYIAFRKLFSLLCAKNYATEQNFIDVNGQILKI